MKRYATSFLLLTFCGAVLAQSGYNRVHSKMLDEAKGLFLNEQWVDAAKVYKRLLDVESLLLGLALPNANAHSPNEQFNLSVFRRVADI